jgi:hypothetical protein
MITYSELLKPMEAVATLGVKLDTLVHWWLNSGGTDLVQLKRDICSPARLLSAFLKCLPLAGAPTNELEAEA